MMPSLIHALAADAEEKREESSVTEADSLEQLIVTLSKISIENATMPRSIDECLASVETPAGREALGKYLESLPFPHYEGIPGRPDHLLRIEEDGTRTIGQFEGRRFIAAKQA